jgi:hypothetical protein
MKSGEPGDGFPVFYRVVEKRMTWLYENNELLIPVWFVLVLVPFFLAYRCLERIQEAKLRMHEILSSRLASIAESEAPQLLLLWLSVPPTVINYVSGRYKPLAKVVAQENPSLFRQVKQLLVTDPEFTMIRKKKNQRIIEMVGYFALMFLAMFAVAVYSHLRIRWLSAR